MTVERAETVLVDVTIAAPSDVVWQAIRDPQIIAQWFGWDYEGLAGEIDFIFASTVPGEDQRTPQFGEWEGESHRFELEDRGASTRLRVVRSGPLLAEGWEAIYSEITEGWIAFVEQLRFLLERHPGGTRRTLRLSGKAKQRHRLPSDALGIDGLRDARSGSPFTADLPTGDRVRGHIWHIARHQIGIEVGDWNNALLLVVDQPKSESAPHGGGAVTLTTFGMAPADAEAIEQRLKTWWESRYPA